MLYFHLLTAALESEEERDTAGYIFERHKNLMLRIAYSYVKNEPDAEDLVMQVAEKICSNIQVFIGKDDSALQRMVARYTRNAATNKYHEQKKRNNKIQDETYLESDKYKESTLTETEFALLTDVRNFGRLQKYVLRLPEQYKTVLMYRYMEELSCRRIADLLQIPESTVSTQVNRALKRLTKMLNEEGNET